MLRLMKISLLLGMLAVLGCAPGTDVQPAPAPVAESYIERTFIVPTDATSLPTRPEQLGEFASIQFTPPTPEIVQLPNGIKLFILEDHELPLVSFNMVLRGGSMTESADNVGLAGFLTSTMRHGGSQSVSGPMVEDSLAYLAANFGISTRVEFTRVSLDVTKRNFDAALGLVADVILHPALPQEKLDELKLHRQESIRRRKDNPREIGRMKFRQVVYGTENPYAREDNLDDVARITRDDLVRHHATWFRPNVTSIAISGDITRDEIVERIQALFGSWESADMPEISLPPTEAGVPPGVYLYPKEVSQSVVRMGGTGIPRHSPDEYAVEVMNRIFGAGTFTSRLGLEVRSNRGLAYYVWGEVFSDPDPRQGMTLALCGTRADNTHEAITVMRDIIANMSTQEITDEEFENAKSMIINSFIFNYTSAAQIAWQQMYMDAFGFPEDYLSSYIQNINAVTKEDVLRVAGQYLQPDNLRILVVGNPEIVGEALAEFGTVTTLTTYEEEMAAQEQE